jgi:L-rhamnonate dehydratase
MNYGRKGLAIHAISAVDLAVWDAYAKYLGEPISTNLHIQIVRL